MRSMLPLIAALLLVNGCTSVPPTQILNPKPPMPYAVTNNAVAAIQYEDGYALYSFLGLRPGKTWQDVTNIAMGYDSQQDQWFELPPVPGAGRLASTAEVVNGKIYIFGGYTVGEDHTEVSTPEVFRFNPTTQQYARLSDMPLPVDDAVSVVYQERYIYLVSGWHDTGNVADVQVYDTQTDRWQRATDFPGEPLFGHAGGLAGNTLIVCDGVKVTSPPGAEKRSFAISDACYTGEIDPRNPYAISWRGIAQHPGPPLYRAAAAAVNGNHIWFVGGTDNPYNYDGTGYNGQPSVPLKISFAYDARADSWKTLSDISKPAMDFRGLPMAGNKAFLIGGMRVNQEVSNEVIPISIPSELSQ